MEERTSGIEEKIKEIDSPKENDKYEEKNPGTKQPLILFHWST